MNIDQITQLLIEHDATRMECHDHPDGGFCCPAEGCEHNFVNPERHQARMIHAAYAKQSE